MKPSIVHATLTVAFIFFSVAIARGDNAPERFKQLRAASLEVLVNGHIQGSGWFAAGHGLAITAAHLVRGNGTIEVLSPDFGRLPARLIATAPGYDLALLRVERRAGFFPSLELAPELPAPGEGLFVFGSPLNRHALLIPGTVATERTSYEWNERNQCYTESLTIAAMTPDGLSGAPWVNAEGRVVGVQSGMVVTRSGLGGLAFAAPTHAVRELLRNQKMPLTAALGGVLAEAWEGGDPSQKAGESGVRILQIVPGGTLERGGVQSGETITTINNKPARFRDDILREVASRTIDETIVLGIVSTSGKKREVTIKLGGCPEMPTFFSPAPTP